MLVGASPHWHLLDSLSPGLLYTAPACSLCAGDQWTHTASTEVIPHVGNVLP